MATLTDFGFGFLPDALSAALQTAGSEILVLRVSDTRAVLKNPDNGAEVVMLGTGFQPFTSGGQALLNGTLEYVEIRIPPPGGFPVPTLQVSGVLWSAAAFITAIRDIVALDSFARLDALLGLQPLTYDAQGASSGVNFGFRGVTSAVTIFGSAFDDTLQGGAGNDIIDPGLSGYYEEIQASHGSDTFDLRGIEQGTYVVLDYRDLDGPLQVNLDGVADTGSVVKSGVGTDTILGVQHTVVSGALELIGTVGNDTFTIRTDSSSSVPLVAVGGAGDDTFNLTLNGDILIGYRGTSGGQSPTSGIVANLATLVVRDGFGGTDRINILGGSGALVLSASELNDSVTGSIRADAIFLKEGNDTATGGAGNDTIRGGDGSDSLSGGDGDDLILPGSNDRRDVIDAGRGVNTIDFAPNVIPGMGERNAYTVSHRAMADQSPITVVLSGSGFSSSYVSNRLGETTFLRVTDALSQGGLRIEGTGLDDVYSIEEIQFGQQLGVQAGRGKDIIRVQGPGGHLVLDYRTDTNGVAATQGVVANLATGQVANDGFGFADLLDIGSGIGIDVWLSNRADSVIGRGGNDGFVLQGGNDTLRGEGGTDGLYYSDDGATAGVRVDLAAGTARGVWDGVAFVQSVTGFEQLWGTSLHDDILIGTRGANQIVGLGGDDTIIGDGFRAGYAAPQAAQVYRLYQATLDRAPDTAGHNDWTSRLAEGAQTLVQVAAGFTGSAEFQRIYGALDNTAFVTLLYQNVLNRAPDTGGLASWVGQLNAGTSRAQVVTGFSESREFVNATQSAANAFTQARNEAGWTDDVFRLYRATLDRAPDDAGFMDWLGRLGNGTTFLSAVAGFTGSREFQNTYGTLDNTAFVTLLYRNVLDRAPDAGGLAGWLVQLAGGTTRAQVVEGFAQSREFVQATAYEVINFVRSLNYRDQSAGIGGDRISGGTGDNQLWGGSLGDEFVFDADRPGQNRVMDFEVWDQLTFANFGYGSVDDILARMNQTGADVVLQDQGMTVTLSNTQLAAITDDSLYYS